MKINASLTISRPTFGNGDKFIVIKIRDKASRQTFVTASIDYSDFTEALTGLAEAPMTTEVRGLDLVGLNRESKKIVFQFNESMIFEGETKRDAARRVSIAFIPNGWLSDNYFESQDTFFVEKGINYARFTVRRWVELPYAEVVANLGRLALVEWRCLVCWHKQRDTETQSKRFG
jgi:hypothetical protein